MNWSAAFIDLPPITLPTAASSRRWPIAGLHPCIAATRARRAAGVENLAKKG